MKHRFSDEKVKNAVKDKKKLRTLFKRAIERLRHEGMRSEIQDNFMDYLEILQSDLFKEAGNGRQSSKGTSKTTPAVAMDTDETGAQDPGVPTQTPRPARLCPYNMAETRCTMDLENVKSTGKDVQSICRLYIKQKCQEMKTSIDQLSEVIECAKNADSGIDWVSEIDLLCSVNMDNTDIQVLKNIMTRFLRSVTTATETYINKQRYKRLKVIQGHTFRIMYYFHTKHSRLKTTEQESPPLYPDLLSSILSAYVDQTVVLARKCREDEIKEMSRHLCMVLGQLLQDYMTHFPDVLIQMTSLTEEDGNFIVPVIRKYLVKVVITDHKVYTKFVCAVRQVKDIFKDKVKDIVLKAKRKPSPEGYIAWLNTCDPDILDEIPITKRFTGIHMTQFILDEAEEDFIEQLLDLLTDPVEEGSVPADTEVTTTSSIPPEDDQLTTDHTNEEQTDQPLFYIDVHKARKTEQQMEVDMKKGNKKSHKTEQLYSPRKSSNLLKQTEQVLKEIKKKSEKDDDTSDDSESESDEDSSSESDDSEDSDFSETEEPKLSVSKSNFILSPELLIPSSEGEACSPSKVTNRVKVQSSVSQNSKNTVNNSKCGSSHRIDQSESDTGSSDDLESLPNVSSNRSVDNICKEDEHSRNAMNDSFHSANEESIRLDMSYFASHNSSILDSSQFYYTPNESFETMDSAPLHRGLTHGKLRDKTKDRVSICGNKTVGVSISKKNLELSNKQQSENVTSINNANLNGSDSQSSSSESDDETRCRKIKKTNGLVLGDSLDKTKGSFINQKNFSNSNKRSGKMMEMDQSSSSESESDSESSDSDGNESEKIKQLKDLLEKNEKSPVSSSSQNSNGYSKNILKKTGGKVQYVNKSELDSLDETKCSKNKELHGVTQTESLDHGNKSCTIENEEGASFVSSGPPEGKDSKQVSSSKRKSLFKNSFSDENTEKLKKQKTKELNEFLQAEALNSPKAKEGPSKAQEGPAKAKETPTKAKESFAKAKETPTKTKESPTKAKESPTKAKERPAKTKESPAKAKESPAKSVKEVKNVKTIEVDSHGSSESDPESSSSDSGDEPKLEKTKELKEFVQAEMFDNSTIDKKGKEITEKSVKDSKKMTAEQNSNSSSESDSESSSSDSGDESEQKNTKELNTFSQLEVQASSAVFNKAKEITEKSVKQSNEKTAIDQDPNSNSESDSESTSSDSGDETKVEKTKELKKLVHATVLDNSTIDKKAKEITEKSIKKIENVTIEQNSNSSSESDTESSSSDSGDESEQKSTKDLHKFNQREVPESSSVDNKAKDITDKSVKQSNKMAAIEQDSIRNESDSESSSSSSDESAETNLHSGQSSMSTKQETSFEKVVEHTIIYKKEITVRGSNTRENFENKAKEIESEKVVKISGKPDYESNSHSSGSSSDSDNNSLFEKLHSKQSCGSTEPQIGVERCNNKGEVYKVKVNGSKRKSKTGTETTSSTLLNTIKGGPNEHTYEGTSSSGESSSDDNGEQEDNVKINKRVNKVCDRNSSTNRKFDVKKRERENATLEKTDCESSKQLIGLVLDELQGKSETKGDSKRRKSFEMVSSKETFNVQIEKTLKKVDGENLDGSSSDSESSSEIVSSKETCNVQREKTLRKVDGENLDSSSSDSESSSESMSSEKDDIVANTIKTKADLIEVNEANSQTVQSSKTSNRQHGENVNAIDNNVRTVVVSEESNESMSNNESKPEVNGEEIIIQSKSTVAVDKNRVINDECGNVTIDKTRVNDDECGNVANSISDQQNSCTGIPITDSVVRNKVSKEQNSSSSDDETSDSDGETSSDSGIEPLENGKMESRNKHDLESKTKKANADKDNTGNVKSILDEQNSVKKTVKSNFKIDKSSSNNQNSTSDGDTSSDSEDEPLDKSNTNHPNKHNNSPLQNSLVSKETKELESASSDVELKSNLQSDGSKPDSLKNFVLQQQTSESDSSNKSVVSKQTKLSKITSNNSEQKNVRETKNMGRNDRSKLNSLRSFVLEHEDTVTGKSKNVSENSDSETTMGNSDSDDCVNLLKTSINSDKSSHSFEKPGEQVAETNKTEETKEINSRQETKSDGSDSDSVDDQQNNNEKIPADDISFEKLVEVDGANDTYYFKEPGRNKNKEETRDKSARNTKDKGVALKRGRNQSVIESSDSDGSSSVSSENSTNVVSGSTKNSGSTSNVAAAAYISSPICSPLKGPFRLASRSPPRRNGPNIIHSGAGPNSGPKFVSSNSVKKVTETETETSPEKFQSPTKSIVSEVLSSIKLKNATAEVYTAQNSETPSPHVKPTPTKVSKVVKELPKSSNVGEGTRVLSVKRSCDVADSGESDINPRDNFYEDQQERGAGLESLSQVSRDLSESANGKDEVITESASNAILFKSPNAKNTLKLPPKVSRKLLKPFEVNEIGQQDVSAISDTSHASNITNSIVRRGLSNPQELTPSGISQPIISPFKSLGGFSSKATPYKHRDGPCVFDSDDDDATSLDVPITPDNKSKASPRISNSEMTPPCNSQSLHLHIDYKSSPETTSSNKSVGTPSNKSLAEENTPSNKSVDTVLSTPKRLRSDYTKGNSSSNNSLLSTPDYTVETVTTNRVSPRRRNKDIHLMDNVRKSPRASAGKSSSICLCCDDNPMSSRKSCSGHSKASSRVKTTTKNSNTKKSSKGKASDFTGIIIAPTYRNFGDNEEEDNNSKDESYSESLASRKRTRSERSSYSIVSSGTRFSQRLRDKSAEKSVSVPSSLESLPTESDSEKVNKYISGVENESPMISSQELSQKSAVDEVFGISRYQKHYSTPKETFKAALTRRRYRTRSCSRVGDDSSDEEEVPTPSKKKRPSSERSRITISTDLTFSSDEQNDKVSSTAKKRRRNSKSSKSSRSSGITTIVSTGNDIFSSDDNDIFDEESLNLSQRNRKKSGAGSSSSTQNTPSAKKLTPSTSKKLLPSSTRTPSSVKKLSGSITSGSAVVTKRSPAVRNTVSQREKWSKSSSRTSSGLSQVSNDGCFSDDSNMQESSRGRKILTRSKSRERSVNSRTSKKNTDDALSVDDNKTGTRLTRNKRRRTLLDEFNSGSISSSKTRHSSGTLSTKSGSSTNSQQSSLPDLNEGSHVSSLPDLNEGSSYVTDVISISSASRKSEVSEQNVSIQGRSSRRNSLLRNQDDGDDGVGDENASQRKRKKRRASSKTSGDSEGSTRNQTCTTNETNEIEKLYAKKALRKSKYRNKAHEFINLTWSDFQQIGLSASESDFEQEITRSKQVTHKGRSRKKKAQEVVSASGSDFEQERTPRTGSKQVIQKGRARKKKAYETEEVVSSSGSDDEQESNSRTRSKEAAQRRSPRKIRRRETQEVLSLAESDTEPESIPTTGSKPVSQSGRPKKIRPHEMQELVSLAESDTEPESIPTTGSKHVSRRGRPKKITRREMQEVVSLAENDTEPESIPTTGSKPVSRRGRPKKITRHEIQELVSLAESDTEPESVPTTGSKHVSRRGRPKKIRRHEMQEVVSLAESDTEPESVPTTGSKPVTGRGRQRETQELVSLAESDTEQESVPTMASKPFSRRGRPKKKENMLPLVVNVSGKGKAKTRRVSVDEQSSTPQNHQLIKGPKDRPIITTSSLFGSSVDSTTTNNKSHYSPDSSLYGSSSISSASFNSSYTEKRPWSKKETAFLYKYVLNHGPGSWADIANKPPLEMRTNINIKDRWRTILNNQDLLASLAVKYGLIE